MGQVLLIGIFAAIILRDEAVTPGCMPESHGLIAAISIARLMIAVANTGGKVDSIVPARSFSSTTN